MISALITAGESVFTTQSPVLPNATDGVPYELGMKFRAAKAGQITAIRYFKAASDGGTHIGRIWSASGTLLSSVVFGGESATGWQQQALGAAVTIPANTTFVVSVNVASNYAFTNSGLATSIVNGDLSTVADDANGLYGAAGVFPTSSFQNSNYFRDVVFVPNAVGPATKIALTPAAGSGTTGTAVGYTATIQDASGNTVTTATVAVKFAVSGVTGTLNPSTPVTPTNGRATASFTPTSVGTATLTATATGLIGATASLTVSTGVGPASKIVLTPATASAITSTPVTYTATIQDATGHTVTTATNTVSFTVAGVTGTFTPTAAVTPTSGNAKVNFTPTSAGTATISAAAAGLAGSMAQLTVSPIITNPITLENHKPGTSAWQITNPVSAVNPEIVGYADATSANLGASLNMKVHLAQSGQYRIDVYRLGYYGGVGGRLLKSSGALNGGPQAACNVTDSATRLIECRWNTSYTLALIGSDWTTGMYVANLTALASGKQSQIWFIVRDDASHSNLLFQSSFNTFQAYNNYGNGANYSLYGFNSTGGIPAVKVSFDRPFAQVSTDTQRYDNMLKYEYNMVRWLESQGYDVSYITDVDTHLNAAQLSQHKAYLSVGHDEYWSREMRDGVEHARDVGVSLGFFSANTCYWRVRFEPSGLGVANRVMVSYKDTGGDPVAPTYRWRDPPNNRPENSMIGVMYIGDNVYDPFGGFNYIVSNSTNPYFRNTGATNGTSFGQVVGFEWDGVVPNGAAPAGLVVLATSPVNAIVVADGLPAGTNTTVSNSVRYTAPSGAKVFATGSIQWIWSLDDFGVNPTRANQAARQFAVNILADMGARPVTPSSGIVLP